MTTAPRRGTRAWSQLRTTWQHHINQAGGWTCRRCHQTIPPHDKTAWQLGHPNDITTGPTQVADLAPEHAHCNTSAGATAGNHARNKANLPPSRRWH